MNYLAFVLILIFSSSFVESKSITITWSVPDKHNTDKVKESLGAIQSHLQALHLAQTLPALINSRKTLQIKLCPPQPYDPLVKEFTVPRLAGYSAIYDHDCINNYSEAKWGWRPKKPENPPPEIPPTDRFKGLKGLTVPAFIFELLKAKNTTDNEVWMLDSESLKQWLTAPIISHLTLPSKPRIAPFQLMSQINSMYGLIGEKDLKNMPQAVQSALVLVLPDYTAWQPVKTIKSIFNPTWWKTRHIPKSQEAIVKLLRKAIDKYRINGQLVIVHHDPTTFNFNIVNALSAHYGEKNLLSSTRVLPKTASTLQLLQFIQKAAGIVVDSRDQLGQTVLLATNYANTTHYLQDHLPFSASEYILFTLLACWFIAVLATRIYYTQKYYDVSLHEHAKRFALFSILALAPIYATCPSLWPNFASTLVFTIIEAGYEFILYTIATFYLAALFITTIVLVYKKQKHSTAWDSVDEESSHSESEEIQLIPK